VKLDGDLIQLRAFESEDIGQAVKVLSDPLNWGCRGVDGDRNGPMSRVQLANAIKSWTEPENGEVFAIERGGTYVGHVRVDWWWDARCPDLALMVAPAHRRQGVGRECAGLVLDHLFGDTLAVTVHCSVVEWNEAGVEFAESLGFRRAGRLRRTSMRDGRFWDTVVFDLLEHEWKDDRAADR